MSIDIFENCQHLWKTDDKAWMADRKAQWRHVQHRLTGATKYCMKKTDLKYLKRYFLLGDTPFPGRNIFEEEYLLRFKSGLPDVVLQIWFHPVEPDISKVKLPADLDLDGHRKGLINGLLDPMLSRIIKEGSADYGLLGGREKAMMAYLNPGVDYREKHDFGDGRLFRSCYEPFLVATNYMGSVRRELYSKQHNGKRNHFGGYIVNDWGLCFLEQFDFAIEHYPDAMYRSVLFKFPERRDEFEKDRLRFEKNLQSILKDLLSFEDRPATDDAVKRPQTVALVESLVARYERRDFSDAFLARWDQAKQSL